nr:hypothetical protein [Tanacetum cinerariifolium]
MLESKVYKTYYAYASGEETPKPMYVQKKADSNTSPKKKHAQGTKGTRLKSSAKEAKSDKKKKPAKMPKTKRLATLSESKVLDEQQQKVSGTNKGARVRPEVPGVRQYNTKSNEESWTFSQDKEDADEETDVNDDSKETEYDNDEDDLTHLNLSTYKEEDEEEKTDDEEMSSDERVSTPPKYELSEEEENKEGDDEDMEGEEVQDEENDLYRDVNINLERITQQQSSSISSDLVSKFIHPSLDTGINSILNPHIQLHTLVKVPVFVAAETPSSDTTIPQPPIPNINLYNKHQFDQHASALETGMSEFKQTNQFFEVVSLILGIVDNYLASKMKEAVNVAVQLQTNKLREEAQAENQEFLNQVDLTIKTIIKEQVQAQVSKIMPKIKKSKRSRSGKEAESSKEPTHKESKSPSSLKGASKSQPKSLGKSAHAEKHDKMDDDLKDQPHQEFNTRNKDNECQWNPSMLGIHFTLRHLRNYHCLS